ncbi:MAG: 4-diphosphocytidyl-2-C-methyl-D-erythritol kinase [Bryobacteraceae bacterium]|nr:MAG: 4-diphosphocytidyl-2-C-methyl-D-erythritol kinase [Bryobacteraceae bacterium]
MLPRRAAVPSFAKVNLSLKVLGRRPDGYHELRTVFQTVGLADRIEFEFAPARRGLQIELDDPLGIEDNLVLRAARLFCESERVRGRLRMRLVKRIPMGAGLGGGSGNAASVLLALGPLTGRNTSPQRLHALAASLGSDVPFFLYGGTALGLGRGEELYPLPDAPAWPALILAPDLHVSTAEAYRALRRPELTSPVDYRKLDVFQSFVWRGQYLSGAENDFEAAVFALHPELKRWKRKLERLGAQSARLSGSGAALFGVFPDRAKLQGALPQFSTEPLKVFSTTLLSRRQYRARIGSSLREHAVANTWPPRSRYVRDEL